MQNTTDNLSFLIYDLLPVGESNKISTHALMQLINEPTVKGLKNRIRAERMNGALILSTTKNGGGYYKPMNDTEITEFIELYSHHAISIFAMLKTAKESLKGKSAQ